MGAIRNPEAGLMEALRTLRAVPGVIAPVRLSLILLACGGTRYMLCFNCYFLCFPIRPICALSLYPLTYRLPLFSGV